MNVVIKFVYILNLIGNIKLIKEFIIKNVMKK